MRANDIYTTQMRTNDSYSTWLRANDFVLCTFLISFDDIMRNDWEIIKKRLINDWGMTKNRLRNDKEKIDKGPRTNGEYCSWE